MDPTYRIWRILFPTLLVLLCSMTGSFSQAAWAGLFAALPVAFGAYILSALFLAVREGLDAVAPPRR